MPTLSYLLALAASLSVALAVPIEDISKRTEAELASRDANAHEIEARAAPFFDFGDWTGTLSSYTDGEGSYVRSGDDYHYGFAGTGVHCWTDLFYVKKYYEAESWVRDATSIDCATTQSCQSAKVKSNQRCASWSLGGEANINVDIIKDFLSVGGAFNGSGGQTTCTIATTSDSCTWADQKCHAVWTSDVVLVSQGYVRRRCSSKNGDYTAWSKDVEFRTPEDQTRIGCAASCSDATYPGPLPLPPS
ncbi:hypothetical protein K440DRAFT_663447 [Wilcoxina mikolae CBS 423.85]|nr:hypothetical protein K440DRAFT_663447 [Wilcoxina mikolae CBS 423.85]